MAFARVISVQKRQSNDSPDNRQRETSRIGCARGDRLGSVAAAGMVRASRPAAKQPDQATGQPRAIGRNRGKDRSHTRGSAAGLFQESDFYSGGGSWRHRGGRERLSEGRNSADGPQFSVGRSG